MRHVVIAHRIDLRGMEISSRTRITEILTVLLLIAIVFMDVEASAASVLSGHVAIAVCPMARRKFPDEGTPDSERRPGMAARGIATVQSVAASLSDVLPGNPHVAVSV